MDSGGASRGRRRCSACGRKGCRLYRYAGEFLRAERIVCRACIAPDKSGLAVPLYEDRDGSVFWATNATAESVQAWEGLLP